MNTVQRVLTIVLLFTSSLAVCEEPKQVHSLDQLPGTFKSKEGLAKFREQMSGVPLPDGFGTSLPAGLSASSIVQLVAPGRDSALATLVGVKPWPYKANTLVAIVCLAANKAEYDEAQRYDKGKPSCEAAYGGDQCSYKPKEVHLAMLEYHANDAAPRLIASYGKPLNISTSWKHTKLVAPQCADDALNHQSVSIRPFVYSRFDFAPFKISPAETAFGIRVGWSEGYVGGGGEFQALMLFTLDGDRIANILSEPIYYSQNIAGSWHKNGTRDHSLYEGENVVTFLPKQTNGHHDLQLRTRGKKWRQVFVWNDKDKHYQPAISKAESKGKR